MKKIITVSALTVGVVFLAGCVQQQTNGIQQQKQAPQPASSPAAIVEPSNSSVQSETPIQTAVPAKEDKSDSESVTKVDTATGYKEAVKILGGNSSDIKLKAIRQFGELNSISGQSIALFYFEKIGKVIIISYNFQNKKATISSDNVNYGDIEPKSFGDHFDATSLNISESLLNPGAESAFQLLAKNNDFNKYRQENPLAFKNYDAHSYYSDKYGWEWHMKFIEDGKKSYEFAINSGNKNVVILDVKNL